MTKNLGTYRGSAILSKTSKMPGYSISTPATDCKTGSRLRKLKGSVCSGCYAMKGSYTFSNVKPALAKRQEFMQSPRWVELMVETLNRTQSPYFRWFDSGDVQSVEHARQILEVVELTPSKFHWIPTKEKKIWRDALAGRMVPNNAVIRLSGAMIDGPVPKSFDNTSTVHKEKQAPTGSHICPASQQQGKCGECRACWNPEVKNVSYPWH